MSELAAIVASDAVIVAGDAVTFKTTLTKDAATYNLTGKTVIANVRRESDDDEVIDATLEDLAVTLGNTNTAASSGGVTLSLTPAQTALLAPDYGITVAQSYLVQFHVLTDDFTTQALQFKVRRGLDS